MAKVLPFKAIRPNPAICEQVVTRSYESYSFKERLSLQTKNPHSFLHVLNPEFESPTRLRGMKRYTRVNEKFRHFIREGILRKDEHAGFYLYRNTQGHQSSLGLFAAMAVSEYEQGDLKRHEDTIAVREKRFADFLEGAQFNAEPVLIAYPNHAELDQLMHEIGQSEPDISFLDDQQIRHELWPIFDTKLVAQICSYFSQIRQTYLMDGHHRSASSVQYAKRKQHIENAQNLAHNNFMCCLIPETEVRIESFNRLLTDLGGVSSGALINQLKPWFNITEMGNTAWEPKLPHQFSMYLKGQFIKLELKEQTIVDTGVDSFFDARILNETILKPIFGIADPRHDQRLSYLWGKHPAAEIQRAVDSGDFAIGFAMYPASIHEIKMIADNGLTLPPKSTHIKPKLPSGLTIYEL